MNKLNIAFFAAVLVATAGFAACPGSDRDERKSGAPMVAAAGQTPAQAKPEQKDADEDEEGAKNPVAAATEEPAPQQASVCPQRCSSRVSREANRPMSVRPATAVR